MDKKHIDINDYLSLINKALKTGILLTTKDKNKVNSMVIGWGTFGVIFEKPMFIVYVRNNRYTHQMLANNPEFTINIKLDGVDKNTLKICGNESGRDIDKIKKANLTLVDPNKISVPGIKEFPLTIECKVIYKLDQDTSKLPIEVQKRFYSHEVDTYHTVYYGEILDSYIID